MSNSTQNKLKVFVILALNLVLIYRFQFFNKFSILQGDITAYDNTIQSSILEHWFNFFKGNTNWLDAGYFFPYSRTIAQTDGYFLAGVIYTPIRLLGFEPYLATEFVGLALKVIGFIGTLILSQKLFKINLNYSLLISTLFTLNNAMTAHGYRIQLATVAFVPWLFLIHYETIKSYFEMNWSRFIKYGSFGSVFFGLWCITCFYMAWFYAFYLLILIIILILLYRKKLSQFKNVYKASFKPVLIVLIFTIVSLVPFIYAYYPKSLETGTRVYEKISFTTLTPENLFQLGESNKFYTPIFNQLIKLISPNYQVDNWEYSNMGISFIIFALALSALIKYSSQKSKSLEISLLVAFTLSAIFGMLSIIRIFGESPWQIIFEVIPGAKALSVTSTFMLLLSLPLYIASVYLISKLKIKMFILIPLILVLIASEINDPLLKVARQEQIAMNVKVSDPPVECEVFYVGGWENQEKFYGVWEWINNQYAHNVSAMMIAQMVNIPTINGMASFIPKDYDLVGPNGTAFSPNSQEYEDKVQKYIEKYKIKNICKLNLNDKKWTLIN
jgi:hypothetical protein